MHLVPALQLVAGHLGVEEPVRAKAGHRSPGPDREVLGRLRQKELSWLQAFQLVARLGRGDLLEMQLTRRDVERGNADHLSIGQQGNQVAGAACLQEGVGDHGAGSHLVDDFAAHNALRVGGVLHLFADRDLTTLPDEPD